MFRALALRQREREEKIIVLFLVSHLRRAIFVTLDYILRNGGTLTLPYFDFYPYSAYGAHYVYFTLGTLGTVVEMAISSN